MNARAKSAIGESAVLAALRAGEKLRVGYFGDASALFDDGDKVESRVISSLRRKGLIEIDRNGFVKEVAK